MSLKKAFTNVETAAARISGEKRVEAFIPLAHLRQRMKEDPFSNLWVFNTSDGNGRKRGDLNIAFKREGEDAVTVVVPATFIPINLADHGDVSSIIESGSFISFVNKGMIRVIDPRIDVQSIFMSDTTWQNERNRLMNFSDADANTDSEEQTGTEGVTGAVVRIINQPMAERQRLGQLQSLADQLTKRDLRYVLKESQSEDVRQFAQATLAEREKEGAA